MKTVEFLKKEEELFSHPLLKGFYLEIKEDFEKGTTSFIFYFDEI